MVLSLGSAVSSFVMSSTYVLMNGIFKGIFEDVKKEYINWFAEYVSHDRNVCFNSKGVLFLIDSIDVG